MGRQSKGQALPYAAAKQPAPRSLSRGTIVLRTIPVVLIAGVIVAFTCAYCNPFTTTLAPLLPFSNKQVVPQCPVQPLAMAPDLEWRPEESREWIHKSAQALGGAVQIPTVTYDDMALDPSKDERFEIFDHFHDYLNQTFPLFHAKARLTKVNRYGLLYELPGSDQSLKPALYAGHQDVVPVPPDTEARWSHKPFGGFYDEESDLLWGRGSSDDKNMLIAIFEAFEQLQKEGFENKRTILFASGFDEEVGGKRGAAKLAETFAQRYGTDKPFEFILDEGGLGIGTAQDGKLDVALPAVGEKGYADVVISITTEGGHSSVPPDHTAIGLLSKMLVQLESKPFNPTLSAHNPILTHLICMADALDDHERRLPTANAEKAPASPGFRLDRSLRKLLRKPHKWDKAAWRISKEGTRAERYVIQTSQAIDVISGGAKANALPESASATVNHRISVDSNVKEVLDSIERIIAGVAAEYDVRPKATHVPGPTAKGDGG